MRNSRYNIQPTFWPCPHCGFVHRPADLLRLDSDNLHSAASAAERSRRCLRVTILAKKFRS
jgi:hypothetical protein